MVEKKIDCGTFYCFTDMIFTGCIVPKAAVAEVLLRCYVSNVVLSKMECFTQYQPK